MGKYVPFSSLFLTNFGTNTTLFLGNFATRFTLFLTNYGLNSTLFLTNYLLYPTMQLRLPASLTREKGGNLSTGILQTNLKVAGEATCGG